MLTDAMRRELIPSMKMDYSPKQRGFLASRSKLRMVRSGNQSGKTEVSVHECWYRALGFHPFKKVSPKPTTGLVLVSDWRTGRQMIAKKFWESAPKMFLSPASVYNPQLGWRHWQIDLVNGSTILFRSTEGSSLAVAGLTVDWVFFDEPPKEAIYGEAMARIAVRDGDAWIAMTPIGRPVDWLKKIVEGDIERGEAPISEWEQFNIRLTVEDCPHRTQASIDNQLKNCPPSELPIRRDGAWEGAARDRDFECFMPDKHVQRFELEDLGAVHLGMFLDHGEKKGRQTALLMAWGADGIKVVDEHISTEATAVEDDEKALTAFLGVHGIEPGEIDLWIGDINSAGKLARGRSVNQELGAALGVQIRKARKRKVSDHVHDVNQAFIRGLLTIHPRCGQYIKSLNQWKHKPEFEHLKHLIDAGNYGIPVIYDEYFRKSGTPRYIEVKR